MEEPYEPASEFLKAIVAEDVPLSGSELGEANLQRLVAMTRDADVSNRDWATMLLSQQEIDTPEVRTALLNAARDEDDVVRAEAMVGLAQRDRALALPFVEKALGGECASWSVFEAAALVADPSLVPALEQWIEPSEYNFLDRLARDAMIACRNGSPVPPTSPAKDVD